MIIKSVNYDYSYNLKDSHQNPNGFHQMIAVVKLSVGKLFLSLTDLLNVVHNNIKQRIPKLKKKSENNYYKIVFKMKNSVIWQ